MAVEALRIDFGPSEVQDLQRRVDAARWPRMPFETGWSAGTDEGVLRDLAAYWRNEYDWFREQEALNRLDHRLVEVEGERIHCVVYQTAAGGERPPLLLIHGWPGSFVEFLDAAELLSTGDDDVPAFDLVVPSLPGYTLSDAPRAPGMTPARIAQRFALLMRELGYERYGVQGGDWGSVVATAMAQRYPEAVVGLHLNFFAGGAPPPEGEMTAEERDYRERMEAFNALEAGYSRVQGTRPQTLAYAQTDSPVGLLAWILEKFWAWSDHGDDLWQTFDRDRLLTNVTLYWLTGSIYSAARLYYESQMFGRAASTARPAGAAAARIEVPTAYSSYPGEPWRAPRAAVERRFNLVRYQEMPRGGHFAAMEQPGLFAQDVGEFFDGLGAR